MRLIWAESDQAKNGATDAADGNLTPNITQIKQEGISGKLIAGRVTTSERRPVRQNRSGGKWDSEGYLGAVAAINGGTLRKSMVVFAALMLIKKREDVIAKTSGSEWSGGNMPIVESEASAPFL